VPGQTDALVGAFLVTGGTGEGADITAIKITDDGSKAFGELTNLKVYKGTKDTGTQIGDIQSSLSTSSSYSFYPSPYLSINANEQIPIYIYADIKTATSSATHGYIVFDEVDGTGKDTNSSVDYDTDVNGQTHHIATAGALSIANAADKPLSANLLCGNADPYAFHKIKFTAGTAEDIEVTRIKLSTTLGAEAPTSSIYDISLWDSDSPTHQVGETCAALDEATGTADFNLISDPWLISAGATKYLTIKAKVNLIINATSAGTIAIYSATSAAAVNGPGITYKGAMSGAVATSSDEYRGNTMYTYKTTIKAEENQSYTLPTYPGTLKEVMYFDVTNLGSYDAYLNGVTTTIGHAKGTGNATASAGDKYFYLYDLDDTTTKLATGTITGTTTTYNTHDLKFTLDTADEIAGGDTITYVIKGNTSDMGVTGSTAGSRLEFYINDGSEDFNWDDNLSTAIQTTRTKTFPLYGGTIQY
jgi:hypothetical protein